MKVAGGNRPIHIRHVSLEMMNKFGIPTPYLDALTDKDSASSIGVKRKKHYILKTDCLVRFVEMNEIAIKIIMLLSRAHSMGFNLLLVKI